jgi:hypothetical protein
MTLSFAGVSCHSYELDVIVAAKRTYSQLKCQSEYTTETSELIFQEIKHQYHSITKVRSASDKR